ncbi:MAG: TonB-dependent receptor [Balneolales bacterium]|nr:TonB-dependent receptor [Balneolales bacterium]
MKCRISTVLLFMLAMVFSAGNINAQGVLTGLVVDATDGEELIGANILLQIEESARTRGINTGLDGRYTFSSLQAGTYTMRITYVGYLEQRVTDVVIRDGQTTTLDIRLARGVSMNPLVFSASRIEESLLDAPVTVESMDMIAIGQVASDSYYKSLGNLKGVDITTSSINFQIINSRGFSSTGNTRMVQLIDGMDTQAPALNFPIGNLNGPSELDIASIEYIPGAASALYGANAFNGVLLINSKSPFQFPGTSFMVRTGVNHLNGDESAGEPGSPQPMYEFSARHAQVFNPKLAAKVNFSYSRATDWHGTDYSDKNSGQWAGVGQNPSFDGVHLFGDDGSFNIGLLALNPTQRNQIAQAISAQSGVPVQLAEQYVGALPAQPVNRTGYRERDLVDYAAENMKINTSLHYRLSDLVEASYSFNYGYGTSIYTGAQRYSLKNFNIAQHKLELNGDNFMVRAYGTFEDSGDSYIADFVGFAVNEAYSPNANWFGTYGATFAGGLLQTAAQAQGGDPTYNQATVDAILSNPQALAGLHGAARANADGGRLQPGTPAFDAAVDAALGLTVPNGALFDDKSRFYMVESQYDFKNEIDFMDAQVGASFRQFQLRSNGTIFDDEGGVNINEFGAYLQLGRAFIDDRLRLSGSIRFDKNENFDGQFSPRLSSVIRVADGHNLRASVQTGFRNPSTQGQYIDLNVITARLLGGLPQFAENYDITNNTYTFESVQNYTNQFLQNPSDPANAMMAIGMLERYSTHNPVKPEQVQALEFGYKGLVNNNLFIDAAYYYNVYDDFITQIRVRRAAGPIDPSNPASAIPTSTSLLSGDFNNTYQIYTNIDNTVRAHGAVLGLEYSLPGGYLIGTNYNWNKLIDGLEDSFQNDFNTPEHKVNVSFGNRRLTNNFGFNITYRWQDAFRWESSFAFADIPAISMIDAQVSYRVPSLNSIVKVGGSNVLNDGYNLSAGGPTVGGIFYVSLTYDNVFRR